MKCPICGDEFTQDYRELDICAECKRAEEELDEPDEPDMSGADGPNSGER